MTDKLIIVIIFVSKVVPIYYEKQKSIYVLTGIIREL